MVSSNIPEINELSTAKLRLTFRDYDGNELKPTLCKYKIDDIRSQRVMLNKTEFIPESAVCDIIISSGVNAIVNGLLPYELRCFTIEWYLGASLMGTAQFIYKVNNLRLVPIS